MSEVLLGIKTTHGTTEQCRIEYSTEPPWSIRVSWDGKDSGDVRGNDLFDCLCQFRRLIEPQGWRLLCNGARLDAFPSALSRQMGGARRVYLLEMGKSGSLEDLVDIFGNDMPAEKVATVEEQEVYYNMWLASLGLTASNGTNVGRIMTASKAV